MALGDFVNSVVGGASILGALLGVVAWGLSRKTDRALRQMHQETLSVLERMDARGRARGAHRDADGP